MAAEGTPCSGFMDWELDTSTSAELKQEKQLSASQRKYYSFCRRKVSDNTDTERHVASVCFKVLNQNFMANDM